MLTGRVEPPFCHTVVIHQNFHRFCIQVGLFELRCLKIFVSVSVPPHINPLSLFEDLVPVHY